MIDWYLEGESFGNCNCNYACPCQFESVPTEGDCGGFEAVEIKKGHFGDVTLDGLRFVLMFRWPGPIFEGKGEMQVIVDERADERQREALETIVTGGETDEAATHWWVFRAMSDTLHETLARPIHFSCDIDARKGKVSVPGVLEAEGRPIANPVNGDPHRVQIRLPQGIEFEVAEIGSGTARMTGAVRMENKDSYGQFNILRHTGRGIVRAAG
ncbi:MAG: DUF1326 domain-containing protein [Alphaproteobacteria bacterium]|nr:DUF1326 domain-containing protein [Alphaproteobacteria bacterium]